MEGIRPPPPAFLDGNGAADSAEGWNRPPAAGAADWAGFDGVNTAQPPAQSPRPSRSASDDGGHPRFSIHSATGSTGPDIDQGPIAPDRLRSLAETIRFFPETLNALLQAVYSTDLSVDERKDAALQKIQELREVIQQTTSAARLDWSCSVFPVVHALEAIVTEWNCDPSSPEPESSPAALGGRAGRPASEIPVGLVEMANVLTEVYATGVTDFLQGPELDSDEEEEDQGEGGPADGSGPDSDDGAGAAVEDPESAYAVDGYEPAVGGHYDARTLPPVPTQRAATPEYATAGPPALPPRQVDSATKKVTFVNELLQNEGRGIGVEPLFQLAKGWLRFSKEVTSYLEKRNVIELEAHKKLSQLSRQASGAGDNLEFCGIWAPMLEEHCRWSQWYRENFLESVNANFVQPLMALRTKQEKERKVLKDTWAKEMKKVTESASAVSRARSRYASTAQDWERTLLIRERDREALERGGGLDARQQRAYNKRVKEEADLRQKVEDARQAYSTAVRQANLLAADVDSYRQIVVTKLVSILFEGGAHLKQVLTSYFDLTKSSFLPRPNDLGALQQLAAQTDSQVTLKSVLTNTMAVGAVDDVRKHSFECFELGADAQTYLQDAGEINQCVAAVDHHVPMRPAASERSSGSSSRRKGQSSRFRQRISRVIGVPLEEQPRDPESGVPKVVTVLITAVEEHLAEEGLYRKPGIKSHIERLCAEIPTRIADEAQSPVRLVGYDAHVLASTLKMYFRQLPTALVPAVLAAETLAAVKVLRDKGGAVSAEQARAALGSIIARMPEVNRLTLAFIIEHLKRVAAHADENKMKLSALAIVFGPTLLRTDGNDQLASLEDMPLQVSTVELLTTHGDLLFPPPPTPAAIDNG